MGVIHILFADVDSVWKLHRISDMSLFCVESVPNFPHRGLQNPPWKSILYGADSHYFIGCFLRWIWCGICVSSVSKSAVGMGPRGSLTRMGALLWLCTAPQSRAMPSPHTGLCYVRALTQYPLITHYSILNDIKLYTLMKFLWTIGRHSSKSIMFT